MTGYHWAEVDWFCHWADDLVQRSIGKYDRDITGARSTVYHWADRYLEGIA
jgi:hypothetical protein